MRHAWALSGILFFCCSSGERPDMMAGAADAGERGGADASTAIPDASAQVNSGSIRLLTYNVAGLPIGVSSSNPVANTPQMSPLLNNYDLVLAQEDFSYHDELAADAMHPHQSVPMEAGTLPAADGLNRFSDSAFSDFDRQEWQECNGLVSNGSDCLAPKGFSYARHTIAPGVTLDVYNLHADAGRGSSDRDARNAQVTQLLDYIDTHSEGQAILVAGDTNMKAGDEVTLQTLLDGAGLLDACTSLACPSPETIDRLMIRSSETLTLSAQSWWIDDLFVDQNGLPLSDHEAIGIQLDWASI